MRLWGKAIETIEYKIYVGLDSLLNYLLINCLKSMYFLVSSGKLEYFSKTRQFLADASIWR